jgi:hypothetical protein
MLRVEIPNSADRLTVLHGQGALLDGPMLSEEGAIDIPDTKRFSHWKEAHDLRRPDVLRGHISATLAGPHSAVSLTARARAAAS